MLFSECHCLSHCPTAPPTNQTATSRQFQFLYFLQCCFLFPAVDKIPCGYAAYRTPDSDEGAEMRALTMGKWEPRSSTRNRRPCCPDSGPQRQAGELESSTRASRHFISTRHLEAIGTCTQDDPLTRLPNAQSVQHTRCQHLRTHDCSISRVGGK